LREKSNIKENKEQHWGKRRATHQEDKLQPTNQKPFPKSAKSFEPKHFEKGNDN